MVIALAASLLFSVSTAGAQVETGVCIVEAGSLGSDAGAAGEGLVAGGWIWRMSYQAQRITALDPVTLEPAFEKALGETDAAILAPLAAVGDFVAVSISGPQIGLVQFLDAATGTAVTTIEIGASPDDDTFRFVTSVAAVGDLAYVAAGHELLAIDLTTLDSGDPANAVRDRFTLEQPVATLEEIDDRLSIRELFSDRVLTVGTDGLESLPDDTAPVPRLTTGQWVFELSDTGLIRLPVTGEAARPTSSQITEIPTAGTPTAFTISGSTLWVVSRADDAATILAVDTQTARTVDEFPLDTGVTWLWVADDVVFVETPDDAVALTLGRCRS